MLNEYILDKMGGGLPYNENTKQKLIDDLISFPTFIIFFAKVKEQFAGMAVCFLGYSTFKAKKILNIHDLVVKSEFRKKGIGKAILQKIILHGFKINCSKITLEVRNDNDKAKSLYKKLGFEDTETPMSFWQRILY